MYAKINNGQLQKYPYTLGMLRKDNPNVSFPKNPSDEAIAPFGVVRVAFTPRPEYDYTKEFNVTAEQVNGVWVEKWIATDVSAEEIDSRTNQKADEVRAERDSKLANSDWTQVADAPVDKAAWATYRQALRDIPSQAGFPWDINWPVELT
jgi:hypothetical protein